MLKPCKLGWGFSQIGVPLNHRQVDRFSIETSGFGHPPFKETYIYIYLSICLSIYLSFYLPIYLSTYLSSYLAI